MFSVEILNIVLCARKQTCVNPAVSWSSWQFISGQGTTFSLFSVFGNDLKSAVDEMPHRNIPAWEYVARGFLFNVGDTLLPTSSNSLWCNSWPAHMNCGGPGGRQHLSKRCCLLSRRSRGVAGICSARPLLPCACPSAAAVGPAMEYGIPKGPYFCHTPCFREYPRLFLLAYIKALRHAINLHLAVLQNLCCQTSLFPKQCLM
jgi:hypothetical protein